MDLVLSGGEDSLLESLSFDLPPTTSYVAQRRLASYFPPVASNFSPTRVRLARFNIAGDKWLDPSSMRIYAKLTNTSGKALQRADWYARGGRGFYGRSHQLFRRLVMPNDWCVNDAVESGL